ncbi:ubiquitin-conjugating enzyme E2 R2-like isoform X2 [Centruroides sculpturatus]|uniref:ubiquitin-conjugating enzyme E2 R2-like isoform X2 n=1 Tax=Centruroides sculpturatus TaxID=218467 RepID=UPI000C6E7C94|nr:ubiquitin-conjugating enzyme E2 R2-like isoform X2 [Centruroides sculpturatus]
MASQMTQSALNALKLELKSLQKEPVEGFVVKLVDESVLSEWEVAIFGPPNTIYEGGYFKARMTFPSNYPFAPPAIRFIRKFWHPNVYPNGNICISILHPPGDDPQSGELSCERWNPTQNVRTILLSVISLLNEPNISSPANVDASIMYRKWKESKGSEKEYEEIIKKQVSDSKTDAEIDKVVVPSTIEDYCAKSTVASVDMESNITDFSDDFMPDSDETVDDEEEVNTNGGRGNKTL